MTKESEKKLNIYQKLNKVMKSVKYVQKEDKKNGMPYRFVSHDSVAAALHDALANEGIYPSSTMEIDKETNRITVKIDFINIDDKNDMHSSSCVVPISRVNDAKDYGSAYSYGYKYIMLKSFMLESGDEDIEVRDAREEKQPIKKLDGLSKFQIDYIKKGLEGNDQAMDKILIWYKIDTLEKVPAKDYERIKKFVDNESKKNEAE